MEPIEVYRRLNNINIYYRPKDIDIKCPWRGTIEDTYTFAQKACDMMLVSLKTRGELPKYIDQYLEAVLPETTLETFKEEFGLFLEYGLPIYCGECRFWEADKPCKYQHSNALPPKSHHWSCCGGIRKEQSNEHSST